MKRVQWFLCLLVAAAVMLLTTGCPAQKAETALYIYVIGSDLESVGGYASQDLQELCAASPQTIPILIQTGGAQTWKNEVLDSKTPQRFTIQNGKLTHLQTLPATSMAQTETLSDFLRWASKRAPARRCGVIFWDHGGGTAMGFGCDELHPYDTLTISDFRDAFQTAKLHAEFVGFDACLMGTLETASMLADCTDYLIASEDTEPAGGWYYTDWLAALDKEPSMAVEALGKQIIEDSVAHAPSEEAVTLSLIRTAKARTAAGGLAAFLATQTQDLSANYPVLTSARCRATELGENGFDQIDLLSFLKATGAEETLCQQVQRSISVSCSNVADTCGLAFYFPFRIPESYSQVRSHLDGTQVALDAFLSVRAYASSLGKGPTIPAQLTGYADDDFSIDLTLEDWYSQTVGERGYHAESSLFSEESFRLTQKNHLLSLPLSEKQTESLFSSEMEIWLEDEEEYLLFGTFPTEPNSNGVSASYTRTWPSLDGKLPIPFFALSKGENGLTGYTTATLNNDADIELLMTWNGDEIQIKGYRYATQDEELAFPARNLLPLQPGDNLTFYCPAFSKGGYYNAICYVGETQTLGDTITPAQASIERSTHLFAGFRLEDLYGRVLWTEPCFLP